jgi:hypothetical protein
MRWLGERWVDILVLAAAAAGLLIAGYAALFVQSEVSGNAWSRRWQLWVQNWPYYVPALALLTPAWLRYGLFRRK